MPSQTARTSSRLTFEGPNAVQKEVKFVRHDGAREFATNSLKFLYEDEGIEYQITVSYACLTNGIAERAIQTIVTIGRSMLHHAKDKRLWDKAVMIAIIFKNRLLPPKLKNKTPSRSCTSPSQASSICVFLVVELMF